MNCHDSTATSPPEISAVTSDAQTVVEKFREPSKKLLKTKKGQIPKVTTKFDKLAEKQVQPKAKEFEKKTKKVPLRDSTNKRIVKKPRWLTKGFETSDEEN